MKLRCLFAVSASLLMSCYAKANASTNGIEECKKADITGGVFQSDNKKPLSKVIVTAYSAGKTEKVVLTDDNGNYCFNDLQPGTYRFVFEKKGYSKVVREKTITQVDTGLGLNVTMEEHVSYDFAPGPSQFFSFE
jgi:hypothetical protein